MSYNYDTEPTFALAALGPVPSEREAELLEFNRRLERSLANALRLVQAKNERIAELEKAGRDVLPTLELYWKGERPIPEWHPTGALRRVLEEDK